MSLKDRLTHAIADPGAFVGMRGERCLTEWQIDAVMAAMKPHDAVANSEPLICYFATEQDRDEFIQAMQEAMPSMRAVPVT
ncbi:MAG: hypothetical protein K2X44_09475 [Magnetospirillum sp.]|nr:hypothetical protein [Magnetospirillum sp.]